MDLECRHYSCRIAKLSSANFRKLGGCACGGCVKVLSRQCCAHMPPYTQAHPHMHMWTQHDRKGIFYQRLKDLRCVGAGRS